MRTTGKPTKRKAKPSLAKKVEQHLKTTNFRAGQWKRAGLAFATKHKVNESSSFAKRLVKQLEKMKEFEQQAGRELLVSMVSGKNTSPGPGYAIRWSYGNLQIETSTRLQSLFPNVESNASSMLIQPALRSLRPALRSLQPVLRPIRNARNKVDAAKSYVALGQRLGLLSQNQVDAVKRKAKDLLGVDAALRYYKKQKNGLVTLTTSHPMHPSKVLRRWDRKTVMTFKGYSPNVKTLPAPMIARIMMAFRILFAAQWPLPTQRYVKNLITNIQKRGHVAPIKSHGFVQNYFRSMSPTWSPTGHPKNLLKQPLGWHIQ